MSSQHSGVSFEVSDRYSDLKVIGQGTVIFFSPNLQVWPGGFCLRLQKKRKSCNQENY
jgi:hypothetical protein